MISARINWSFKDICWATLNCPHNWNQTKTKQFRIIFVSVFFSFKTIVQTVFLVGWPDQLEPGMLIWRIMTAPVVLLERGYCNDLAERWANRTVSQPSQNNGVSYKIYIYLHECTTHNSSRVSVSTSRHPNIHFPTSSYRHTARSVAVRHTPWLRRLRAVP